MERMLGVKMADNSQMPQVRDWAEEEPVAHFSGELTSELRGWSFEASRPKNGLTYNEFEGYYPDKGGKLSSGEIPLAQATGRGEYCRLRFEAQAVERAYQGIDFYDKDDRLLPDCYDVVYPGGRTAYDRVFYAMPQVAKIRVFFRSSAGVQAWNLSITKTTVEAAAEYCDRVYAKLPPVWFTPPADAMALLPKTASALRDGRPWNVVLLGDSIMQDTFHSQFPALLKRAYPGSNLSFKISMRGSTGCWHYCQADQFKKYVLDPQPDLLIIGGVSNYHKQYHPTGTEAMEIVVRAAKEYLGCEVLLLSSALASDTRMYNPEHLAASLPAQEWILQQDKVISSGVDLNALAEMAQRQQVACWDMTTPTYRWLYSSGLPYEYYSRDNVHSGELGKQIIGRTLVKYFLCADAMK